MICQIGTQTNVGLVSTVLRYLSCTVSAYKSKCFSFIKFQAEYIRLFTQFELYINIYHAIEWMKDIIRLSVLILFDLTRSTIVLVGKINMLIIWCRVAQWWRYLEEYFTTILWVNFASISCSFTSISILIDSVVFYEPNKMELKCHRNDVCLWDIFNNS